MGYLSAFKNVYKEIQLQKRFNNSFLLPYLDELEKKYDGTFAAEQRQKIVKYYGLFITSFLCSSYKHLYGQTLTDEERKRATLFGILTPVGDDLFDIDKLDVDSIAAITFTPETYTATTFAAHVAKEIQTFLLTHVPHVNEYVQASAYVLYIQAETAKQTNKNISLQDLQRITYTKGAVSVVIYHQCLNEPAGEQMLDALFYIGSLYQLGNDLFDLYKDVRDNIYTLVNTCKDFTAFKQQFLERVRIQNQKIHLLPYDKKRKQEFCIIMNTINARSMVAIDQFARTQQKQGKAIDWWKMERKDMIVDMEKPANFLKWLYYIYKLPALK
ncbi:hypothetical protein FC093_11825 [Ilyomonas limi]|uniref:Class 1 isoprenoid biosynthesis enzyme n=1 Tax=Ilyomonas limi TaxID=2575867 RepID=A0A4U3L267_9BACT|nr:hypothetical protein [Ilyomonas limi]TKK68314.1 hypothetical protein FC093_11825 [Ilyomonas limi]